MAEKTYIVRDRDPSTGNPIKARFGFLRNREKVEKAALEGRNVLPVVEYVEQGQEVELDPDHELTKKAVESGVIEEPGASQRAEQERLEVRAAELKAQADALDRQSKAAASEAKSAGKSEG